MARRPISMNKQLEILRLKGLGLKERAIARTVKASRKTVRKYLLEIEAPTVPEASFHFSWEELIRKH